MKNATFLEFLRGIENAQDFAALSEAFGPIQNHYGLASFLCARIATASGVPVAPTQLLDIDPSPRSGVLISHEANASVVAATVDPDWMRLYLDRNHAANDPVVWQCMVSTEPFLWDLRFRHPALPDIRQQIVLDDAAAFGVTGGMIWPVHEPGCGFGLVSCFTAESDNRMRCVVAEENITLLTLLIHRLYRRCAILRDRIQPQTAKTPLTKREQEVLHWSALGKSVWEIARILDISERTVRFHLSRAEDKLGAGSRSQAISLFINREWDPQVRSRYELGHNSQV